MYPDWAQKSIQNAHKWIQLNTYVNENDIGACVQGDAWASRRLETSESNFEMSPASIGLCVHPARRGGGGLGVYWGGCR